MVLAAFWVMAVPRLLESPTVPSIAVDIVTEADYQQMTRPLASLVAPVPQKLPQPAPEPLPPKPAPEPVPETDPDMVSATQLLANDILQDPKTRQVRDTLTLLEHSERITQLCNIEGLEQLRLLDPKQVPDSLDPTAMVPTTIQNLTLEAKGGAYRLNRKWYGIRLTCTVAPDYLSVIAFSFAPGEAIPKDQWESHNLIDEDVELD